jgi:hypothetical protein
MLEVYDLRFPGNSDCELHANMEAVHDALHGDQVQCDAATINRLCDRLPPKIGEANCVVMGDVRITLTRIGDYE